MSDRSYGWVDAELFWSNVHQHGPNGCHVWQLSVGQYNCPKVYGKTNGRGHSASARRVAWTLEKGLIPVGLELHPNATCADGCVNPEHSRLVTRREVILLSVSPAGLNAKKTACPRGHLFAIHGGVNVRGDRYCNGVTETSTQRYAASQGSGVGGVTSLRDA